MITIELEGAKEIKAEDNKELFNIITGDVCNCITAPIYADLSMYIEREKNINIINEDLNNETEI